jgi:hypothetical protein
MKPLLALLLLSTPTMAQADWCVSTTWDYSPSGCNRSTPNSALPITTTIAARAEMVKQANILLAAGHVTKAQYDAEMTRIKLQAKGSAHRMEWLFETNKPGYYIWITAR